MSLTYLQMDRNLVNVLDVPMWGKNQAKAKAANILRCQTAAQSFRQNLRRLGSELYIDSEQALLCLQHSLTRSLANSRLLKAH